MLETANRRFKLETRGTTGDNCSQIMAYATDVVIMGKRLQDSEVFTSVVDSFGGLVVSMLASGTEVCGFKPG